MEPGQDKEGRHSEHLLRHWDFIMQSSHATSTRLTRGECLFGPTRKLTCNTRTTARLASANPQALLAEAILILGKFPKIHAVSVCTRTTGSRPLVVSPASLLATAAARGSTARGVTAMCPSRVTMLIAKVCAFSLLLCNIGEQG